MTPWLDRIRKDLWSRPGGNFAALDGLRGFASVIVVFYHSALFTGLLSDEARAENRLGWLEPLINGFWSGIDIFFVLSGFLITRILLLDLDAHRTIHYRRFIIRRFCRIFPAYYLVLTFSVLVVTRIDFDLYYFLFGSLDRDELVRSSWTNYVYLNNYLRPGNEGGVFSWGWSLCVEEHFYLLLPPFLWFLIRSTTPRSQVIGITAALAAPLAGRALQYAVTPDLVLLDGFYYYSHNRFDEIFVGVLIALLYVRYPAWLKSVVRRLGALTWLGGVACIASVWGFAGLQAQGAFAVVGQFFVMAIGTGLLLLNGIHLDNVATRFFAHPLWYPLARVSYGTYLIHPFVLFAILEVWMVGRPGLIGPWQLIALFLGVMTLSTILACVLFMTIESPFLNLGIRWSERHGPKALPAGSSSPG
jgi:peptidoglycan/LPS O-acetylase OafA/YrhL